MIKDVFLSICDNCDTVSVAPEYTSCPNCGRLMKYLRFIREAVEHGVQATALESPASILNIMESNSL